MFKPNITCTTKTHILTRHRLEQKQIAAFFDTCYHIADSYWKVILSFVLLCKSFQRKRLSD